MKPDSETLHITHFYPKYSTELLNVMVDDYLDDAAAYLESTRREFYDIKRAFAHKPMSYEQKCRIRNRKVCCMSLFFKPSTQSRYQKQPQVSSDGKISLEELQKKEHHAFEGSYRFNNSFIENYVEKILNSDFGDWLPVLFLAKDLSCLKPLFEAKGWLVVEMLHSSTAHSPGAMWRYLGFNLNCICSYFQDTDRSFSKQRADYLAGLLEYGEKTCLTRPLQWTAQNGEMALILGNDFAVKPERIAFDASRMMLGYIVLNILHEDRVTNFCHEFQHGRDDTAVCALSKRRFREHQGPTHLERIPHKCYPYYCFDEQWLKEYVYYQMTDGKMVTLLNKNVKETDLIQSTDLSFQREAHNDLLAFGNLGEREILKSRREGTGLGAGMNEKEKSSFIEYAQWYLSRDRLKRAEHHTIEMSDEHAVDLLRSHHSGKIGPSFERGRWTIVDITDPRIFEHLVFLDDDITRSEGLVQPSDNANYRLLHKVADNAIRINYFENCSSMNLRKYVSELESGTLQLTGSNRLVLRTLIKGETLASPRGTFYLQDGNARALAYMALLKRARIVFRPIEAFVCDSGILSY